MAEPSPAYQMYPKDWLSCLDILMMSAAQEGAYIRLINTDWSHDGVPDKKEVLAAICRIPECDLGPVLDKFVTHPKKEGFLTHARVQKERKKQKDFLNAKVKAGKASAKKRWGKSSKNQRVTDCNRPITDPVTKSNSSSATSSSPSIASSEGNIKGYQLRIGKWKKRRESTKWDPKEIKALKAIGEIHDDDMQIMESYYTAEIEKDDYRRTTIQTLLNNWTGELDRARAFKPAYQPKPTQKNQAIAELGAKLGFSIAGANLISLRSVLDDKDVSMDQLFDATDTYPHYDDFMSWLRAVVHKG